MSNFDFLVSGLFWKLYTFYFYKFDMTLTSDSDNVFIALTLLLRGGKLEGVQTSNTPQKEIVQFNV